MQISNCAKQFKQRQFQFDNVNEFGNNKSTQLMQIRFTQRTRSNLSFIPPRRGEKSIYIHSMILKQNLTSSNDELLCRFIERPSKNSIFIRSEILLTSFILALKIYAEFPVGTHGIDIVTILVLISCFCFFVLNVGIER